jgi:hypothetical protein
MGKAQNWLDSSHIGHLINQIAKYCWVKIVIRVLASESVN